jgi:creatinine amidohydrolase
VMASRLMKRAALLALCASAPLCQTLAQAASRPGSPPNGGVRDFDMPRPIAAHNSVWIEELTWLEVRDAIRAGKTTVIIATGGVEQNGPYLATGKHNVILRATAEAIARKLGNALVAPIVPFVPEGQIDPPSGMMRFPGTISVSDDTFKRLLADIASSLRAHGFRDIVLIGDSGGNQTPMREVATSLMSRWTDGKTAIHYVPEYYDWPGRQNWLRARGINEVDEGIHDEFSADAIMMVVDPTTIRMKERIAAGKFSIHGVPLAPAARTITLGRELVDHIATTTADAIQKAIAASRARR